MSNETGAKRVRVSDADFCLALKNAYDNDGYLSDVAEALGMKPLSVYQRYNKLRKDGVNIPDIPMHEPKGRQRKEVDVDALSNIFA